MDGIEKKILGDWSEKEKNKSHGAFVSRLLDKEK